MLFYKQNVLLLTSWGELLFTNETDDGTADFLPTTFHTCARCVAFYNRYIRRVVLVQALRCDCVLCIIAVLSQLQAKMFTHTLFKAKLRSY